VYNALKIGKPIQDGCWWKPCVTGQSQTYVPPELRKNQTCPAKLCEQVYNIIENGDVDIRGNENNILCDLPPTHNPPTDNPPTPSESSEIPKWVIPVIIGLVVLLIMVVVFYYVRKRYVRKR
jgi:hypothetical protein